MGKNVVTLELNNPAKNWILKLFLSTSLLTYIQIKVKDSSQSSRPKKVQVNHDSCYRLDRVSQHRSLHDPEAILYDKFSLKKKQIKS